MSRAFQRLFPHPLLTLLLAIVWVLLQNSFTPGTMVFGLILGIVIPAFTAGWWPERPKTIRMGKLAVYTLIVLWDILVANIQVAWIVLTRPNDSLRTHWIVVPLRLRQPEAITLLAGTITLTPGTVSADLSDEGHSLLVHTLDTGDPDATRDDIIARYESRLLEIFP